MQQSAATPALSPLPGPELDRRVDDLQKRIKRCDEQIARIRDPHTGMPVGQMQLDLFARSGAKDIIGVPHMGTGYHFYFYPTKKPRVVPDPGKPKITEKKKKETVPMNFTNSIAHTHPELMSDAELFLMRCQKIFFATQPLDTLALHADPFNAETRVILGPNGYTTRKVRLHQGAAVGQGYFAWIESQNNPEVREAARGLILTPDVFGALRNQPGATLDGTLREAATLFAVSSWNNGPSVRECLQEQAMNEFEFIARTRTAEGDRLTFVRMDTADGRDETGRLYNDILAIGEGTIPNPFGRNGQLHPEFREEPMSFHIQNRINLARATYGIGPTETLPTIREGLAAIPLAPQEFIDQSRRENVLEHLDRWMKELGPLGINFNKSVKRANCVEAVKYEQDNNATAVLGTFGYPNVFGHSLVNTILYSNDGLKNLALMFSARAHEQVHALQILHSAAAQASPYNSNSEFILVPEDFTTVGTRMEQAAYPHGTYLAAEAAKKRPAIRDGMRGSILTVDEFNDMRGEHKTLNGAFRAAANFVAEKKGYWADEHELISGQDNWQRKLLAEYRCIIGRRLADAKAAGKTVTFVRLDTTSIGRDNDILPLGIGPGPNPFGKNGIPYEEFTKDMQFSAEIQAGIDALRRDFGLPERHKVRTLGEELALRNTNKASYISKSRGHGIQPLYRFPLPRELKT